jgi:hypothetical protein
MQMAMMFANPKLEELPAHLLEGFDYAIVEAPDGIEFLDLEDADFREMGLEFPRGVAFGEMAEVRWLRRSSGVYHVVWVRDDEVPPAEALLSLPLATVPGEPRTLMIWGEREADGFYYEGRIPKHLDYPDRVDADRLAVEVRHYVSKDGSRRLFRCVRIVAAG